MKHSLEQELSKLDEDIVLSPAKKSMMKKNIIESKHPKKVKKFSFMPSIVTVLLVCLVATGAFFFTQDEQSNILLDSVTPEQLQTATQTEETFLIEWLSDTMDRGNHDLYSNVHGKLVVSSNVVNLQRGAIIYYELPSSFTTKNPNLISPALARIIGLPGETVEIRKGQVYIDDQKLQTFYGRATIRGQEEELYFESIAPQNKQYEANLKTGFQQNIDPIKVQEQTIFVLVDQWTRGIDSRDIGLIDVAAVKGIVLGYE